MSRLADYFIVIGYDHVKERSGSGVSIGKIIQRFPEQDWPDYPFIDGIELFCQPTGWRLSNTHQQPKFFVAVLTNESAEQQYCAVFTFHEPVTASVQPDDAVNSSPNSHRSLTFVPKSLVILSRLKYFDTFKKCLSIIYSIYIDNLSASLETVIGNLLGWVYVPAPGGPQARFQLSTVDRQAIQAPLSATIPSTSTSVAILFNQLGIHNTIMLFCAILTDHKLLFLSTSYTRLTQACHALTSLLFPLKYSYVYIPILPASLLEVLHSPTPFIAGIHSSLKDNIQDLLDVVVVDVDGGSIHIPECVQVPLLPESLLSKTKLSLTMILYPDLHNTDLAYPPSPKKPSSSVHRDKEIRAVFIRMFSELFQGYRSSLTVVRIHPSPFIAFHKAHFLGHLGLADDEFLLRVLDGMCFNAFVAERGPPYRVCDIFDEVYATLPDHIRDEMANSDLTLKHIQDMAAQLFLNENPNSQPYVQKVPLPTEGAYARIHQPPFPILDKFKVQERIEAGVKENEKSKSLNPHKPLLLRVVPMGVLPNAVCRSTQVADNSRRLEVLRSCITCIFDNKILDARKVFPAVIRALKYPIVRKTLCSELAAQVKLKKSMVEHQQFDFIVRLLNCALQNDTVLDENGIAAAILPLSSAFCRRLCAATQFAYTCIQEHAVWRNAQFWQAAFYQDVQDEVRRLYLPHYEEHSVHANTTDKKSSYSGKITSTPREISALEIAAEQLRIWSSLSKDNQDAMISNEESTVYSQAIHYANRMVYLLVPLDAHKKRNEVSLEPENNSNSNITASLAESDSQDDESGFEESDMPEVGSGITKFITRFMDKVCSESGVTADHQRSLQVMIPGIVNMHVETLESVYNESKRLPPIQKSKILTPAMLPGEEVVMDGLRGYLISDGREEGQGSLGGPCLLPAEGAIFLTAYRIVFKGTPCDPIACEQIVVRSFPVSSLTKDKKITLPYQTLNDQRLSDALQLRSSTFQLMNVAFDEEVGPENIESFKKTLQRLRNPYTIRDTFAFMGATPLQSVQLQKQKDKNSTLKHFAKLTLLKKKGTKSKDVNRKQKYMTSIPAQKRHDLPSHTMLVDRERQPSDNYDQVPMFNKGDFPPYLADVEKNLEKLFVRLGYSDYKRLGFGTSPRETKRNGQFKISSVNSRFTITRSYPALVVVPSSTNEESICKLAQFYRQSRFPAIVWKHPRTNALLLRSGALSNRSRIGVFKSQTTTTGQSLSDLSAPVDNDNFLQAIIALSPNYTHQKGSNTNSLSSVDSFVIGNAISESFALQDRNPSLPLAKTISASKSNTMTGSLKPKDVNEDQPQVESTSPTPSQRSVIRRAVDTICSTKAPTSLGRLNSSKDKNRYSSSSLNHHLLISEAASPVDVDPLSSSLESLRHVPLYIFGEKSLVKRAKLEVHRKCEFVPIEYPEIRHVKATFKKLLRACVPSSHSNPNDISFYKLFEESEWLQQMQKILQVAGAVVDLMDSKGSSVLLSLEDGTDFTTQVSSTAQLLMDPYYRTFNGFHALIDKEWLSFGHRFTHRSNQTVTHATSGFTPIFLQWLDVIHQIMTQFPLSFEYNQTFLKFVAYHSVSNRFYSFMLDNELERLNAGWILNDKASPKHVIEDGNDFSSKSLSTGGYSVWDYIDKWQRKSPVFYNFLYAPHIQECEKVLRPCSHISNLRMWEYFLSESLAHGSSYDFDIMAKELQMTNEVSDIESIDERRRCIVNSCYDDVSQLQPDVFQALFQEIKRVEIALGQLSEEWQQVWGDLHIEPGTLKRSFSVNTHVQRVHSRTLHKRMTVKILLHTRLQSEKIGASNQPHHLENTTFSTPTKCDYCTKLLSFGYGNKTGMQCPDCGYKCHVNCAPSTPKNCSRVTSSLDLYGSSASISNSVSQIPAGSSTSAAMIDISRTYSNAEHHAMSGHLFKRGAFLKGWKKRWFILDSTKNQLRYYDSKDDHMSRGHIDLGEVISAQIVNNIQGLPKKCDENAIFEMKTVQRVYHFIAANAKDAVEWIEKLQKFIQ